MQPTRQEDIMSDSRGNVFLIIIGILVVIFIMATFFMQTTIEEKTQTVRSNRSIQAQCLAESGLEIALGYLASTMNKRETWADISQFGHIIRTPLARQTSKKLEGMEETLGTDYLLDVSGISTPIVLHKADLQAYAGDQLDEIFAYTGGDDPGKEYDLEITLKVEKAMTNLPGPSVEGHSYKIPGIDLEWACHSEVTKFLNNQGYQALELRLPDGLQWLQIPIKIDIMGAEIFSLDLVSILQGIIPDNEILALTDLNKLLTRVFEGTEIYPYEITFATNVFPDLGTKFGGITPPGSINEEEHLEKTGYISVQSKATITYPDRRVVAKQVIATKEFKCADVEPPASLYSFFISNLSNSWINFNNLGGDLFINSFAGFNAVTGTCNEPEKREFPGLVRVNGTKRMDVNLSILGNPSATGFEGDSFLMRLARGCEWLLMTDISAEMNNNLKFAQTVNIKEGTVNAVTNALPGSLKGTAHNAISSLVEENKVPKPKENKPFIGVSLNVIPSSADLGIFIWQAPLHFLGLPGGKFKSWEMPYCGNSWSQFTLPLPLFSTSVTHLFGSVGIFAPMTRDIEGFVAKRYRQWNIGVISLPPTPAPLGKSIPTPWGIPILPIPVPIWHAHNIVNKYEYNLYTLKTNDSLAKPEETRVYNPHLMANSPPNLYSVEQYAKKANFYYATAADFYQDLPNRMVDVNGKKAFRLDGVNFVKESITLPVNPAEPFYVYGRGAIVCGGNLFLKGNIEDPFNDTEERSAETPRTVFSLILRHGGIIVPTDANQFLRIEGSVYTDKCIGISQNKGLKIVGNWVTNAFSKALTRGDIMVEHVSYKTRSSLNSVHPIKGKYDPERYFVSFAPGFETWRVQ
jgi:hypothetical protein